MSACTPLSDSHWGPANTKVSKGFQNHKGSAVFSTFVLNAFY